MLMSESIGLDFLVLDHQPGVLGLELLSLSICFGESRGKRHDLDFECVLLSLNTIEGSLCADKLCDSVRLYVT